MPEEAVTRLEPLAARRQPGAGSARSERWMLTALCYDLVGGAYRKSNLTRQWADIGRCFLAMAVILRLIWGAIADFFRSRAYLQTEIIALGHQLNVMRRKRPEWLVFCNTDRLLFVWMYRLAPDTLNALSIVKPETVIGWHRQGFRAFWRWKSRSTAGRPKNPWKRKAEIAARDMDIAGFKARLRGRDFLIEKLKHQLAGLRRHRFGSTSEALDQLELTLEEEVRHCLPMMPRSRC